MVISVFWIVKLAYIVRVRILSTRSDSPPQGFHESFCSKLLLQNTEYARSLHSVDEITALKPKLFPTASIVRK